MHCNACKLRPKGAWQARQVERAINQRQIVMSWDLICGRNRSKQRPLLCNCARVLLCHCGLVAATERRAEPHSSGHNQKQVTATERKWKGRKLRGNRDKLPCMRADLSLSFTLELSLSFNLKLELNFNLQCCNAAMLQCCIAATQVQSSNWARQRASGAQTNPNKSSPVIETSAPRSRAAAEVGPGDCLQGAQCSVLFSWTNPKGRPQTRERPPLVVRLLLAQRVA